MKQPKSWQQVSQIMRFGGVLCTETTTCQQERPTNIYKKSTRKHSSKMRLMSGGSREYLYHVTYPMMHLMLPSGQTDACENITSLQLRLRSVEMFDSRR